MRKKERTVINRALSVHHSTETPKRKGPELFDVRKELEKIFKTMDAKRLKISEKEILDEIAAARREKRKVGGANGRSNPSRHKRGNLIVTG